MIMKRKLLALGYDGQESIDVNDDMQFRSLIIWLEDKKINHLKTNDQLLKLDDSSAWTIAMQKYLTSLKYPYQYNLTDDRHAIIDWLLGYAVRLEYGDKLATYQELSAEKVAALRGQKNSTRFANPLDKFDFSDPEIVKGIQNLAKSLHIPQHPDHLVLLKAISIVVQEKLSNSAIKEVEDEKLTNLSPNIDITPLPLDRFPLGGSTGDKILDRAGKALRLLHVHELRDLQTRINEAIVAVQTVTADPKTDERLGKVGRF